jgi:hypothetical protein
VVSDLDVGGLDRLGIGEHPVELDVAPRRQIDLVGAERRAVGQEALPQDADRLAGAIEQAEVRPELAVLGEEQMRARPPDELVSR